MAYIDSVRYLYSLGNELKSLKFGLEGITRLLDRMGNPQNGIRFIHVAGTNGKGSTCALIESALRAAGFRTGLYTSPHLAEPTERIRIGGVPVSTEVFTDAFQEVHRVAEEMLRDELLETHPTYFETVTAMAFLIFRDERVDWVALEVGLGGRLDATNVVRPEVAVITPVDFDHEKFLGTTIESIAREKAGILKPGVPAIFAVQRREAASTLLERAKEVGAPVTWSSQWTAEDLELHARGSRFVAVKSEGTRKEIRIDCPLPGEFQVQNVLTAVTALDHLGIPPAAIEEGVRTTRWPGRLEHVRERPEVILDGAHNPAGARALAAYMERFRNGRRIWLVFGAMRDKSVEEMAGTLLPHADEVILTAPSQPRAVRPQAICGMFPSKDVRVAPTIADAVQMLSQIPPGDLVFITGSLFTVGEARSLLVQ